MYRMISALLLLHVLCFVAVCNAVEFTDCGSTVGKFTAVTISGCDTSKPTCDLVRDTNASIEITFTLDKDITKMNAVIHGVILDVPIPFPMPNADACKNSDSGIKCPLKKGGPYTYRATLPVEKSYPKLSVTVKFELQDESNQDIVCVYIPAKIK